MWPEVGRGVAGGCDAVWDVHLYICSDKKAEVAVELKEEVEQLRKNAQKLHQEVCICVGVCIGNDH